MRPQRFETFVLELAQSNPQVGATTTLRDSGDTTYPYGLSVKLEGRDVRYQFIAQPRDGDRYDEPENVTEAERPFHPDAVPAAGLPEEQFMAGLVGRSGSPELLDVTV
ncbi:hypothetical protein JJV70_05520 [Streptomyces sp. JJ66]|uniref:hypothetical protein n=1 Tax=Streptomyces sp. JJ66 TaxID=2803843 RepID=UPI001C577E95|nr:hypothetical protein [Streptomyces sp. JJ66]MBW1601576.1 hypothetical protein [Streptomyces sp. JJ66]